MGPLPAIILGNAWAHAPRVSRIAVVINSHLLDWNCSLVTLTMGAGVLGGTRSAWARPRTLRDSFTVFDLFAECATVAAAASMILPCARWFHALLHRGQCWRLGELRPCARTVAFLAGRVRRDAGVLAGTPRE